jgi:hypothetical protein
MADRASKTLRKPAVRVPAKPRNPFVALAAKRVAGAHRKSESARRAADREALKRSVVIAHDDD